MKEDIELRLPSYYPVPELRMSIDVERKPVVEGHAAVFNQPSLEIFGVSGWREIIRPGAFRNALKSGNDVVALFNHDPNQILARLSAGNLSLEEDGIGLRARFSPSDTTYGRDVMANIRDKNVSKMSFGFRVHPDGQKLDHSNKLREIVEVSHLYDVSPVTEPAYPATNIGLRASGVPKAVILEMVGEDLEKTENFLQRKELSEKFLREHAPKLDRLDMRQIYKKFFIPSF